MNRNDNIEGFNRPMMNGFGCGFRRNRMQANRGYFNHCVHNNCGLQNGFRGGRNNRVENLKQSDNFDNSENENYYDLENIKRNAHFCRLGRNSSKRGLRGGNCVGYGYNNPYYRERF